MLIHHMILEIQYYIVYSSESEVYLRFKKSSESTSVAISR